MRELVILCDYPLSPSWRLYLDFEGLRRSHRVTLVEIKITGKQRQAFSRAIEECTTSERIEVSDFAGLIGLSSRFEGAIVVDLLVSGLTGYLHLNRNLRKRGCRFVKVLIGTVPDLPSSQGSVASRLSAAFRQGALSSRIARWLSGLVPKHVKKTMAYDYSVLGGSAAARLLPKRHGKLVFACGFDFCEYEKHGRGSLGGEKYALLIEENFSNNSDGALVGYSHVPDPRKYFDSLAAYLDEFRLVTGLPIKVLPHPKTDRAWLKKWLPDFEQVAGPSARAVAGAQVVLTHMSTAVSYAILGKKPIVLVHCEGVSAEVHARIEAMAEALGIRSCAKKDLPKLRDSGLSSFVPSDSRRTAYVDDFVKHPRAAALSFREVVASIEADLTA